MTSWELLFEHLWIETKSAERMIPDFEKFNLAYTHLSGDIQLKIFGWRFSNNNINKTPENRGDTIPIEVIYDQLWTSMD